MLLLLLLLKDKLSVSRDLIFVVKIDFYFCCLSKYLLCTNKFQYLILFFFTKSMNGLEVRFIVIKMDHLYLFAPSKIISPTLCSDILPRKKIYKRSVEVVTWDTSLRSYTCQAVKTALCKNHTI